MSIQVTIDAGVPLQAVRSPSHDVHIERPSPSLALVRLTEQAITPNKDFILRYTVSGKEIQDAILFHSHEGGGYFTMILQPPARIAPPEVVPKELSSFPERVHNPLLTDLSIEWQGLPVEDVYPKRPTDLFAAKPVILTGRYRAPGKGRVRLLGRTGAGPLVPSSPGTDIETILPVPFWKILSGICNRSSRRIFQPCGCRNHANWE